MTLCETMFPGNFVSRVRQNYRETLSHRHFLLATLDEPLCHAVDAGGVDLELATREGAVG